MATFKKPTKFGSLMNILKLCVLLKLVGWWRSRLLVEYWFFTGDPSAPFGRKKESERGGDPDGRSLENRGGVGAFIFHPYTAFSPCLIIRHTNAPPSTMLLVKNALMDRPSAKPRYRTRTARWRAKNSLKKAARIYPDRSTWKMARGRRMIHSTWACAPYSSRCSLQTFWRIDRNGKSWGRKTPSPKGMHTAWYS